MNVVDLCLFTYFGALLAGVLGVAIWVAMFEASASTTTTTTATTTTDADDTAAVTAEHPVAVPTPDVYNPWMLQKTTHFVSEDSVNSTFLFMQKYFPVEVASDDCQPDGRCMCGAMARFELTTGDFGLHAVYAAGDNMTRYKESGHYSLEELEDIFIDKFGEMNEWVPEFDSNTGLWTPNITPFVEQLDNDGKAFYAVTWPREGDENGDAISVIVHVPGSQILYEVVSYQSSAPDWLLERADTQTTTRWRSGMPASGHIYDEEMSATWLSRVTSDIERDVLYYKDVFMIDDSDIAEYTGYDVNGNEIIVAEIKFYDSHTKLRLVQPVGSEDLGSYSITWWEEYLLGVHKQYNTSPICGWDILGDNHYALTFDNMNIHFDSYNTDATSTTTTSPMTTTKTTGGTTTIQPDCGAADCCVLKDILDITDILQAQEDLDLPYFCRSNHNDISNCDYDGVMKVARGVMCYLTMANGWQMQLEGFWVDAPMIYSYDATGAIELCTTYNEHCEGPADD